MENIVLNCACLNRLEHENDTKKEDMTNKGTKKTTDEIKAVHDIPAKNKITGKSS